MPELPEVETSRRELEPHLVGARIERVELRRPDLRAPFPPQFATRLIGQTVTALGRRAKYLLASLSSGDTLLMHFGMSGSFRVDLPPVVAPELAELAPIPRDPHDHVVFHLASGTAVTFNDPRRFGSMDLLTPAAFADHAVLGGLGLEPLSPEFDAGALALACRSKKARLKVALLDQRIVAGVGNIYACEALHVACLSPRRRAGSIATPGGAPRDSAHRLAAAIKRVLTLAIERAARPSGDYRTDRFRVYDRDGKPCPRRGCGGTVARKVQAGRSTFYCPKCQR